MHDAAVSSVGMLGTGGGEVSVTAGVRPSLRAVRDDEIAAAYAHCREVTRTRARNFYYGLRLTPEPRRSAIYSIYAWMRSADDAVDRPGPPHERRARLEQFASWSEDLLGRTIGGDTVDAAEVGPLGLALAATVASYPVEPAVFRDTIAGMRRDLDSRAFADESELARYCYCVAGTAGLACVSIWGLQEGAQRHGRKARELALRRGQAFQRTNILRDFAADFDGAESGESRVYLPREAMSKHGLTAERLRAWADPAACSACVREQASLARENYLLSAELESLIDPACAPTLWAMTRIYSGLLAQIEADPRRAIRSRVRLAPTTKAMIAIRASIGARMRRW